MSENNNRNTDAKSTHLDILRALDEYSTEIATWRIEMIERELRRNPERNADFTQSLKDIDRESGKLILKLGGDYTVLEPLIKAQMAYQSEILFEVFHQAALDGGRVFQAFIEHELPRKETAQ